MKRLTIKTFNSIMALLSCATAAAEVAPSSLIGDNMVLQQNADAHLWGKATPNSTVKATPSWDGAETATVKADVNGNWLLSVATPAASFTPYTITLSDGDGSPLTLSNILIGEVWLAGGQSNMQMPLKGFDGCNTENGYNEIADASDWADRIRFFVAPLKQSYTPETSIEGKWDVPSYKTAPEFSATAWFFAKRLTKVLDIPVGIIAIPYGGAKVESWMSREQLEKFPDVSLKPDDVEKMVHYHRPLLMYNAMFCPVKNYTVNGIIWYQGCSNVGQHEVFPERLSQMVANWRSELGRGEIPFYSVEIAPFEYNDPEGPQWAPYLREAQWKAVEERIPNSGIISTNDLVKPYERHNIHPSQKTEVGNRLANLALNRTYGKEQFIYRHPRFAGLNVKGSEARVKIDSPDHGICRNYDLRGFEIAGEDRTFYPADSATLDWQTNEVVLTSDKVPAPVAVRYCFRDWQSGTLCGGNDLPLVPFRSDNWKADEVKKGAR